MRKCDILALIEACKERIELLLSKNISDGAKKDLKEILRVIEKHYNIVNAAEEDNVNLFNSYANCYSRLYYKTFNIIKKIENNESKDLSVNENLNENELGLTLYSQISEVDNNNELDYFKSRALVKSYKKTTNDHNDIIDVDYEEVSDKKKIRILKDIIAVCGSAIIVLAIITSLVKENKRLKKELDIAKDDLSYKNTVIEDLQEIPKTEIEENMTFEDNEINEIIEETKFSLDINDEDMLYNYAQSLQELLPENTLTTEEIINCLKLANFDELENQSVFASREELFESTSKLGTLVKYAGTEKTVIENENTDIYFTDEELKDMLKCITNNELLATEFDQFKSNKGYNSYKIYEYCAKMLNNENNQNKVLYAKLFNEITARKFESFSVTPDSPLSTYYLMLAIFNENMNASLALTTNHGWGPTYGNVVANSSVPNGYTGDTIDGTYGYICIEELINHLTIGNPDYSFYSIYADEFMIDKSLSR
ncbi:MAG: hypothetical protein PUD07_00430 [bacterium]|nr:hypothetical protein [bacterium]